MGVSCSIRFDACGCVISQITVNLTHEDCRRSVLTRSNGIQSASPRRMTIHAYT
jgi:hypothetical protein